MFVLVLAMFFAKVTTALSQESSFRLQNVGFVRQYTYIMRVSGSNYQMIAGNTGNILFQSGSSSRVFNYIVGNCSTGDSIYVEQGFYYVDSMWNIKVNNLTVIFQRGAILRAVNNLNSVLIFVNYVNGTTISGVEIDGNAVNQNSGLWGNYPYQASGIGVTGFGNLIIDCIIYNCRVFGVFVTSWGGNCGVVNCTVYNCGANAIQLNGVANYAIGNTCWGCSDVGIAVFGPRAFIANNYIYDINGSTGFVNSHVGITVESSGYATITNNTIKNCYYGIATMNTVPPNSHSNYIAYNEILNVNQGTGVSLGDDGHNVATHNYINGSFARGIEVNCYGNIVSFNRIIGVTTDQGAISLNSASNNSISNNTITLSTSGFGIWLLINNNQNIIQGNNIQAEIGIVIQNPNCNYNKLCGNILVNCTVQISDSGTGTIINPDTSAYYSLVFCNTYDGSGEGVYVYANNTSCTITLNEGSILNVNGVNVYLEDNQYILDMMKDYFVYVTRGFAIIS